MAQTQNIKLYMFKIPFYKHICLFLTEMQNVFYAKFDKKISLVISVRSWNFKDGGSLKASFVAKNQYAAKEKSYE